MEGKVHVFFSSVIKCRILGVWLKASANMYHLIQLSQKGSLSVQFTQMCWLRFYKWTFLNISCNVPHQTLLLVFLWSQCKETQPYQLWCDLQQVTHLTFLSFPSFIFKMGTTNSTLQSCDGEDKKWFWLQKSLQNVRGQTNIRYIITSLIQTYYWGIFI